MNYHDEDAQKILNDHQESIIIYLDKNNLGESDIKMFTKLEEDNSVLSTILAKLLENLQRKQYAKTGGQTNKQINIYPQEICN